MTSHRGGIHVSTSEYQGSKAMIRGTRGRGHWPRGSIAPEPLIPPRVVPKQEQIRANLQCDYSFSFPFSARKLRSQYINPQSIMAAMHGIKEAYRVQHMNRPEWVRGEIFYLRKVAEAWRSTQSSTEGGHLL